MALPVLSYPLFDVVIPSTQKKIKMRPFLVREEKILLIAQTSGDPAQTIQAIKQVIEACAIDPSSVTDLTTFDLEYLFVKLRAKSVNNVIDIIYNDPEDNEGYKVKINLDEIEIKTNPEHKKEIALTDTMGIVMRYPPLDIAEKLTDVETEVDLFFKLIKECIDQIYDEETIYNVREYTSEEVEEFVSSLDVNAFKKIQKFFDTTPKLYYEASYERKDGSTKTIVLQNLNDFFTLG
jgi:hypothetical protein